jgi:antitoxin (DNA-binding transcriptional repressor) of toxin-antitoxin stability system
MDEVKAKREPVAITKHGRPVAKLVPVNTEVDGILGFFNGRGTITGDIVLQRFRWKSGAIFDEESPVILVDTHLSDF